MITNETSGRYSLIARSTKARENNQPVNPKISADTWIMYVLLWVVIIAMIAYVMITYWPMISAYMAMWF